MVPDINTAELLRHVMEGMNFVLFVILFPLGWRAWQVLTAAKTQRLLALVTQAAVQAVPQAVVILRAQLDAARAEGSPGGKAVTSQERRHAVEYAVAFAMSLLVRSGLFREVLRLYGAPEQASRALESAMRHLILSSLDDLGFDYDDPPATDPPTTAGTSGGAGGGTSMAVAGAVCLCLAGWAGEAQAQVPHSVRNVVVTATDTPQAIGGAGCKTIVLPDSATVAHVGWSDLDATKGVTLCTDPAACSLRVAVLPVRPGAVWVWSATSAVLRVVVLGDCTS